MVRALGYFFKVMIIFSSITLIPAGTGALLGQWLANQDPWGWGLLLVLVAVGGLIGGRGLILLGQGGGGLTEYVLVFTIFDLAFTLGLGFAYYVGFFWAMIASVILSSILFIFRLGNYRE